MVAESAKRICVVTTVHRALDVRIFHKECRWLAQAGYTVDLVAPHACDEVIHGIRVWGIPAPMNRASRMIMAQWRAYRIARRLRADVYHIHDPELIPMGLALWVRGGKVVYDVHEDFPSVVEHRPWIPKLARTLMSRNVRWLEGMAASRFAGIVTADDALAQRFGRFNRQTVAVQNYPCLEEFVPGLEESRYGSACFVSFGGISSARCAKQIVDAMGLLSGSLDVRLILGGALESPALLAQLSAMPAWSRVEYRGVVDRQSMHQLLARSAAALVLYDPAPNHWRVRSNRFFEALAAGAAVITSDFPEWRRIVQKQRCGLVVDPCSPREIADAIAFLATHPAETVEMGRRGWHLAREQFNWSGEGAKLCSLYRALMAEAGGPSK